MTEEVDAGQSTSIQPPQPGDSSRHANPKLRKYAIGISILLIAYGAGSVTIGIGVLAFMSMDTAFRPEPCLAFVIAPVLVLLVPCLIGLLRLKEWGIYLTILYLIIFGLLPGFTILPGILGILAGILPIIISIWLFSRRHQFAK